MSPWAGLARLRPLRLAALHRRLQRFERLSLALGLIRRLFPAALADYSDLSAVNWWQAPTHLVIWAKEAGLDLRLYFVDHDRVEQKIWSAKISAASKSASPKPLPWPGATARLLACRSRPWSNPSPPSCSTGSSQRTPPRGP